MNSNDALTRVKHELSQAWLASPERIADLRVERADAAHVGEFEIRSVFVARDVESVEEPLAHDPTAASQPFDQWAVDWPPDSERIGTRQIDVRETYDVLACPPCAQAGETSCGVCRGSGKVADPKTNKPTRCSGCKGKGSVICGRCQGRGRLLRFKRINQKAKNTSAKLQLPNGAKVPAGATSGTLAHSERTPGAGENMIAVLRERLVQAAPGLASLDWPGTLATRFVNTESPTGLREGRPAWRTIEGRWYEGWRLHCVANGKKLEYFVPHTGAKVVGPKLRSPKKIASVAIAATVLLVGAGVLANWRANVAREEREVAEQRAAQVRAADEKRVAEERAAKEAQDRKEAAERERQRIEQAVARTKQAATALVAMRDKSATDRRAGFEALSSALADTNQAPDVKSIADASAAAVKGLKEIRDLDTEAAKTPHLPDVPDKPTYEKPAYHGAFYLDGEVRGNYEGDPVVQAGGDFYVVRGLKLWIDGHYVEATTDTVTLNIGRDGREATFADVSTRETYNDDQERYAAEVQNSREMYQRELADYTAAVRARQQAEADARRAKQASDAKRAKAQAELDSQITKVIATLAAAH